MSPSRLVISLAALTLSAAGVGAGCSKVANLTGQAVSTSRDSSPTVSLAAGPRLGSSGELGWLTTVEDRNRRAVLANSLCGEDQGRPLVCALAPLGRVEATFCPAEDAVRLRSVRHYNGLPVDARSITDEIVSQEGK